MSTERFGKLIREARRDALVTLQNTAKFLGVSAVYISEVELSKRPPFSIQRIQALAKYFQVSERPLIEAAIRERKHLEIQGSSPSKMQLRALSGMARGELSEKQWEQISNIVEKGTEG